MFDGFGNLAKGGVFRYQILEVLDEGTFGIVYRAQDKVDGNIVALKKPKAVRGYDVLGRFRKEINFYQQMSDSPFVVKMLDFNVNPGSAFIAMEFCNLGSARKRLWELQTNKTRTVGLLCQAATALALAHQRSIYHRDIKPDNLLLSSDEQNNWTLKLGDSGMACFPAIAAFDFGATRTPQGTESYLAPELFLRNAQFTRAADVFSFGVTATEMLTGIKPIAGAVVTGMTNKLNKLLTDMIAVPAQQRPMMKDVASRLAEIHGAETASQNRWQTGVGLAATALIGYLGYHLLKDS